MTNIQLVSLRRCDRENDHTMRRNVLEQRNQLDTSFGLSF